MSRPFTRDQPVVRQRVDLVTIIGLGAFLMPVLTMWHEIAGHAAACVALGGHVETVGAFYVNCSGLTGLPVILVACAGVAMNVVLAAIAYRLWRKARRDGARLFWWLVWVSEAFVAAGYLCFSGVTGVGDLGVGKHGALAGVSEPLLLRVAELAIGVPAYVLLVRFGIRTLTAMLGGGPDARASRRRIAHGFYLTAGAGAMLTGLLNPVGIFITIMSAAASSFGGLAGFVSIGFANPGGEARAFVIRRNWPVVGAGIVVLLAFAAVFGPSLRF